MSRSCSCVSCDAPGMLRSMTKVDMPFSSTRCGCLANSDNARSGGRHRHRTSSPSWGDAIPISAPDERREPVDHGTGLRLAVHVLLERAGELRALSAALHESLGGSGTTV